MAYWIWFPHDFEIDLRGHVEMRRQEHGMTCPSIWRMDAPTRAVAFKKQYTLEKPGSAELWTQGEAYVRIDGVAVADKSDVIDLPAGEHMLSIEVMNLYGLPALYLQGDVSSDASFFACENNKDDVPVGCWDAFDAPDKRPMDYKLPTRLVQPVAIEKDGLVDFGKESFGFVRMTSTGAGAYTVYYGESAQEARAGKLGETWDGGRFDGEGQTVVLPSRAMRYVYVDGPVDAASIALSYEYNGLAWRAAFTSDDERLNAIYDTSAYTMELCTREFFLDGIKRDRWVWAGDALQSVMMNHYSYFDKETSRRTLTALRGRDPFTQHINTILDYTFYWMISIWEDYFHTGDASYIHSMYPKMVSAMDYTRKFWSADGFVVGQERDWVFVDWADISKEGELCIEQVLMWKALCILSDCAQMVGDAAAQAAYARDAAALKEAIISVFWSKEKGTLLHQRVDGKVVGHTRYAPMFALMYGMLDEDQQRSVIKNTLLAQDAPAITTPYMRFYEMDALMRVGEEQAVIAAVKDYWGGMLDIGATSIWEQFDPTEEGDAHYAMYGRPFGRSLCHCWGAGPIYLCGKYLLGVAPTQAGYATYDVKPSLAGLGRLSGKVPTSCGEVEVTIDNAHVTVSSTCAGVGKLYWMGKEYDIPAYDGIHPSVVNV